MSRLQFDKYAFLSRKGFCWEYALLSQNEFHCKYAPWVCLVQTFTHTFRIWLRFCADIWTKNRRLASLPQGPSCRNEDLDMGPLGSSKRCLPSHYKSPIIRWLSGLVAHLSDHISTLDITLGEKQMLFVQNNTFLLHQAPNQQIFTHIIWVKSLSTRVGAQNRGKFWFKTKVRIRKKHVMLQKMHISSFEIYLVAYTL